MAGEVQVPLYRAFTDPMTAAYKSLAIGELLTADIHSTGECSTGGGYKDEPSSST